MELRLVVEIGDFRGGCVENLAVESAWASLFASMLSSIAT